MSYCTCKTEVVKPNAAENAPYFPGIVRFEHTRIVEIDPECSEHGFRTQVNVAAILRYGD